MLPVVTLKRIVINQVMKRIKTRSPLSLNTDSYPNTPFGWSLTHQKWPRKRGTFAYVALMNTEYLNGREDVLTGQKHSLVHNDSSICIVGCVMKLPSWTKHSMSISAYSSAFKGIPFLLEKYYVREKCAGPAMNSK